MLDRGIFLIFFALIALGYTTKCPKRRTSPAREILCYTSTFDVQLFADSICSCTTLVHQDHDVRNLSISDIADLRKSLRDMYPFLQFVISIHDTAKTLRTSAMLRQEAVARIIAIAKEVDGIELNVTAGSKERFYNFIKSLKDEMVRKSYDKRIFVVLPTKPEELAKQFDLKELIKYVDLFTLPTDYLTDEDGAFVTFHPSRLMGLFDMLNTDSLIDLISELGAPKRKILVSLPANAYKFILKDETENAPRSETVNKEPIAINRKQLCDAMKNGEWIVERDEDLTAPYAFQNNTWISFEDKISVGIKGKYALLRDLAGLAVRNIENDTKTECEKPITQEIYRSFTEFKRKSRQAVLNALEDELHQAQFSYPNQAKTSNFRVIRAVDTEGHIRAIRENTQTEFVCKRQGYFVHPKSCNRFYRCVKFNQAVEDYSVFEFDCPTGLSFDERTEVCVWPGSLPQGSPCPGSSEIAPVTPKRFECPSEPGYYADPQNCRWFFACIDLGESQLMAFEFRCPYGLVFDEKKLVCEWPWLVPSCSESGSAYTRTKYDYTGHTAESSTGIGLGGYVTGDLPEYSVTNGAHYPSIDYSRTTGIHEPNRVNYYGSTTGHAGGHGISSSNTATSSEHIGLSGPASVGYSASTGGYEGSSIPTYSGPSDVHVSPSRINIGKDGTGYSASTNGISSIRHDLSTNRAGIGYTGVNIGYPTTGSFGGISEGAYESTVGGYSGTRNRFIGGGVTYSGIPGSSYFGSTVEGHTASVSGSNTITEGAGYSKTPETSYFESTSPGSATNIHVGSIGPKYSGSMNLYTGSSTLNADGYSASTGAYPGISGHQPLPSGTGPLYGTVSGSSYSESTAEIHQGFSTAGYSKTTGGISDGSIGINVYPSTSSGIRLNLPSSTSSQRIPETNFISDTSKYEPAVSGIPIIPEHTGVTTADSSHFTSDSTRFSGVTDASSTRVRYNNEKEYTIPVLIQHEEPIYSSIGTTDTGEKGHKETSAYGISVTSGYRKPDFTTSNLNISVFGNKIPTGYNVPTGITGTILSGSSVEGSILTDDSLSGTLVSHGNIPGTVSTAAIDRGTIITGRAQPGYVTASAGTPGYVIQDGTKIIDIGSVNTGSVIYGTPTPAISLTRPSMPGITLKGDITPGVIVTGQTAPGVSIGGSIQPGSIVGSTSKPYVPQSSITYHGISGNDAATRGSTTYSSSTLGGRLTPATSQNDGNDARHGTTTFNAIYDINKYTGNDILDYRPTSATLPDSIVSGGRIESTGGVILGSTLAGVQDSTTAAPGYFSTKSPVFTPSGFTKTGPTKTGITTAILGGGGSYSISTSERRPILNPENIGEKAFEGNVAGHPGTTKTSSISNVVGFSSTIRPFGYSSTSAPADRITLQSPTSGYSYPKPAIQFETSGTFSSATRNNLPVTTPTSFLNIELQNGSPNGASRFGLKIPTISVDRGLPTSTIHSTEYPETYRTTLFNAAHIPVSTAKPITDSSYKTGIVPTGIPVSVLTDDRFTKRIGGLPITSIPMFSTGLGVPSQQTASSGQKDYSSFTSSPNLEYLPGKSNKPDVIVTNTKYDIPTVTGRPELVGITYKKPSSVSDVTYESPSSVISPTTFRPSDLYYSSQGFSTVSSVGTTPSGGSPTNLDISKHKIDELITNYDTGIDKHTSNVYDTFASPGIGPISSKKFSSSLSSTKSSSSMKAGSTFAVTPSGFGAYEVTTKSPEGKGKVIVKWSDLHPLLLGKLGAECTCKADPFATLRGPIRKLIDSSKGKVDLANYDESEIYVDLENDDSSEEGDYITNYDDFSPQPYKISPHETTSVATVSANLPSSSYLPVSSTTVSTKGFRPSIDIRIKESARNNILGRSSTSQTNHRTGKRLKDIRPSPNSITINHEEDPDQIIDGATDCARPGLFRHPNLCNKFYACHWDQWKKKFTLHIFNCPVHLTFDSSAGACNWPSKGPACQADNLLVESLSTGVVERLRQRRRLNSRQPRYRLRESVVKVKVVRARRSKSRKVVGYQCI